MKATQSWRPLPAAALLFVGIILLLPSSLWAQPAAPDAEPSAPALQAPADGAVTTAISHPPLGIPSLAWAAVEGATKYQVQISVSSGFGSAIVDGTTVNTAYTPAIALGNGVFYWHVRAASGSLWGPYSDTFSFEVDWTANSSLRPQLISPEDGATRAVFTHEDFTWTTLTGAASYKFEIAADADFANIVYSEVAVAPQHTPVLRLGNSVYFWRVTPIDNRGHAGLSSEVRSFTFSWSDAPQLLAPANGTEMAFVPRFSWTAVEGAKEYRLQVSTQDNFAAYVQTTTRNTDYTPDKAYSNDQDYFWRVQAVDARGTASPWSQVRRFRARWYFRPQLLAPANNSIRLAYPFFSWAPVPGAERYQIMIADNLGFNPKIVDTTLYNVTNYTQPEWEKAYLDTFYYWQVRAIDAQGNYTPWSDVWSFQFSTMTAPGLVYPLPYYLPDEANLPVHGDRSFGSPIFIWDTAHAVLLSPFLTAMPDYYVLEVDDDPAFQSPNFAVSTTGLAAAPTAANPFTDLQEGRFYYWRVRAYLGGQQHPQADVQMTWLSRYTSAAGPALRTATAESIYPPDDFEAVVAPPVLGWLPVSGAAHYRVQVARDSGFTNIVDEAEAQFLNYVPWQARLTAMPCGGYWWRVRAENAAGNAIGDWSTPRRFNLSLDLAIGNPNDYVAPDNLAADTTGRALVASSPEEGLIEYELRDLFLIEDRRAPQFNQNWVVAFTTGAQADDNVLYALYFDTDHVAGSGGSTDPLGNNSILTDPYYRPEYVIYVNLIANVGIFADFYGWNGSTWGPRVSLSSIGGYVEFDQDLQSVQLFIPYTALGSANSTWSGSLALAVYSLEANAVRDTVPEQGATLADPVFVSNMVLPLYPFDTPFSNPIVYYDMPPMRWRMPTFGTDGYQVQVARDSQFTEIVETWESFESSTWPFFSLIPATFQSKLAYANNESYYWRVRNRHEKYNTQSFDYGPWSPAMRFKLDSRRVGNPQLSTGVDAFMTPTFIWDRVEGASRYTIQIDDDSNFSDPLIDQKTDATSFTPADSGTSLQPGTQYYWRVVMNRSSTIIGQWSDTLSFTKASLSPVPVAPLTGAVLDRQPTLAWSAVLTPTLEPRLATPTYRVQVANNSAFTSPKINTTTQSTSYTPAKGELLGDGVWYWRVALVDANNKIGPYSPLQSFVKEYPLPVLLSPGPDTILGGAPTFSWAPVSGAAYYKIEYADNSNFSAPTSVTTDLTKHTPTKALTTKIYYWRVQMYDVDRNPGSLIEGRFTVSDLIFLPTIMSPP